MENENGKWQARGTLKLTDRSATTTKLGEQVQVQEFYIS